MLESQNWGVDEREELVKEIESQRWSEIMPRLYIASVYYVPKPDGNIKSLPQGSATMYSTISHVEDLSNIPTSSSLPLGVCTFCKHGYDHRTRLTGRQIPRMLPNLYIGAESVLKSIDLSRQDWL